MNISVVIPSFNRLPVLTRAIQSVLDQTSAADEIIVIDDGSTDGTEQVVCTQFQPIKYFRQGNRGISSARNLGIQQASHPWIALLDSDDSWQPNKIEQIRLAQQSHPESRLIHSDEIWIRNDVRVNAMNKHKKHGGWIFQQCLPLCVISPSAAVIHREIFDLIGLFDESLPVCEDYDLWLRICHRYPVHYIDEPLITKYGGHADQLSRAYWGMDRFRIRSLEKLLSEPALTVQHRSDVEAMLKKKLTILLKGAKKHANQLVIDEFQPLLERHTPISSASC